MPITCVGYVRVSTEQQATEDRTSLADQEAAIRRLADQLGADVGRWFRDAGASGATVEGRPAFRALLEWCETNRRPGARGYVLVLNDSRFGRFDEPEEATYWRHHLHRLGWTVRFCEGDDVQGDFRTVVRAIGSVQASEYRRALIANTRRGMRGAAELGFWTREAPYGFRRQVVGSGEVLEVGQRKAGNDRVRLTPHEPEAKVVRWAFEAYAAGGESLGSLARELRRREPGRKWSRRTVGAMLRNDAYRGAVVGGVRSNGEPYGREGAHPALVGPELWHAAQRRLDVNAQRGAGVRSHYLLSGLLRCVHCGEAYTGGGGGRSRNRNPERSHRRFYRDSGGISGACPGRIGTIMRHLVDDAAVELVATTLAEPAVRRRIERAVDDALERAPRRIRQAIKERHAAIHVLDRRRARLLDAVADGAFLPGEVADRNEQLRAELAEHQAQLDALRFAERRAGVARSERARLLERATNFAAAAEGLTGPRLRALVEPWLGRVTFDKVSRKLTLGIRPVLAVPSLALVTSPARGDQREGRLIVRSTSLVQRGHEERIARALRGCA